MRGHDPCHRNGNRSLIEGPNGLPSQPDSHSVAGKGVDAPNIVDASYNALYDALTYKLFRDGAKPAQPG